jgi:hypothetical protein
MARFLEINAWNPSKEKSFDAVINLDLTTCVTRDEEGRAVVNLVSGASFTVTTQPYADFVAMLDTAKAE